MSTAFERPDILRSWEEAEDSEARMRKNGSS